LILLPGDLAQIGVHEVQETAPQFCALLAPLHAPLGAYFVLGNVDRAESAKQLLAGTDVQLLVDRTVELHHGDRTITLGGIELLFPSLAARATIRELEERPGERDVRILLAHYPDVIDVLNAPSRIDLVVAGHTHGGQVVLPFVGAPITLSAVSNEIARGGYHEVDGKRIYVSRGVGCERGWAPRVRFNCPPEVSCLTLE
jgi:predicted MPP superfamily phosphohydrolase